MKPIKLEIEGLQSYEAKQVIDFNTLTSRGIFGIFGATGSGKSTILDAIILALYGKVHRSKTNSDFINLKSKQAVVSFDFSFTEDGQTKIYSVRRSFKRKNKQPQEVDHQAEVFEIGAMGSRQVVEGVNKVDKFIVDLLGMSDVEFLKCIALPQGEFASFLKSKPYERVAIIGNIFDLNKYGQELWEKVKLRTEALEKDLAVLDGKLTVVGDISSKEVDEANAKFDSLAKDISESEAKLNTLTKTEREEREVARLGEELERVNETIKKCEEIASSITIKREALKKAKKLHANKFVFLRTEELSSIIINENDEIYRMNEALNSVQARAGEFLAQASSELDALKSTRAKSIAKLERLRALKDVEVRVQELKKLIEEKTQDKIIASNKIEALSRKFSESNVTRGIEAKKLDEVDAELVVLKEELRELESVLTYKSLSVFVEELKIYKAYIEEKYEEAVRMMTKAIDAQNLLVEQKKDLISKLKGLHSTFGLKGAVDSLKLHEAVQNAHKDLAKFAKIKGAVELLVSSRLEVATAIVAEENKREKLESDKVRLDAKFKESSDEIDKIKQKIAKLQTSKGESLSANGVGEFISRVRIGDECPICKNEILVKGAVESIDIMVIDNEINDLTEILTRKEEVRDNILYSIAKIVSKLESVEERTVALEAKQSDLKKQIAKLFSLGADATIIDEEEELKNLESNLSKKLADAEKAFKQEKTLHTKLRDVNDAIIKQNCVSATARLEVEALVTLLNKIADSIKVKDIHLLALLSNNENISEKVSKMEKLNVDLERKMAEKETIVARITEIDSGIRKIETELALTQAEEVNLKAQILDAETKLKADTILIESETVGGDVQKSIELETQEVEGANHREAELLKLQEERKAEVNKLSSDLNALISQSKAHKAEHKGLAENVIVLLKDLGVETVQEAKLFMMEEAEISALEISINSYDNDYVFAKTRKTELETALSGKVSSTAILAQMQLQIDVLTHEIREKKDTAVELKLSIEQMKSKLKVKDELMAEFKKVEKDYNLSKELYELLKGKALLEFIAEEFINDISFMASNKLQVLMDGRYVLKYQNKEFFVIDNFNDANERHVSTLSGGEMFVVSLALALSISDAIASKSNKNIDFFFLDEGFGTLDKDYCEYIVDSLIKLESQNIIIGLISHIPELQEKIIQKLGVVKTPNGTIVKSITDI